MKTRSIAIVPFVAFLTAACLVSPKRLNAQAPPGPLPPPPQSGEQRREPIPEPVAKPKQPPVPARTTIGGPWKLNADDSDDPLRKVRAAEESTGGNNNPNRYPGGGYPGGGYPGGGYPGGGYPGGGYPGGGYPGGGYPGGGWGRRMPEQDIQGNPKMQSLIHASESLTIDVKTPEIDVTDDQLHKLMLYTDGRQLPKTTDNNNPQVLAHWNGSQLVSDEKSPLGGKMSRTFVLSSDGRQLTETLRIDNSRTKTPLVIRYVYDATSADMENGQASDPDRPVLKRLPDGSSSPQQ